MATNAEELTLRLEGTFDVPTARFVQHTLSRSSAATVRLDFSQVSEFHDFAVAILAQTLARQDRAACAIQGLRLHQVRLLRYFGVDPAAFRIPQPRGSEVAEAR